MRRWIVALVALASFGAGWIVNDLAEPDCITTTREGGRYVDGDVTEVCGH